MNLHAINGIAVSKITVNTKKSLIVRVILKILKKTMQSIDKLFEIFIRFSKLLFFKKIKILLKTQRRIIVKFAECV